jgi:hypothetical protein
VDPVAGCSIKDLPHQGVEMLMDQFLHWRPAIHQFPEGAGLDRHGRAG